MGGDSFADAVLTPSRVMKILNLKERYSAKCLCGNLVDVSPSLFMECMQQNIGGAACPKCKIHMFLSINKKNDGMNVLDKLSVKKLPSACYREATKKEEKAIESKKSAKVNK